MLSLSDRIHKSDEYQRGDVTVFSSQWIHAVEAAGGSHMVAIGPYVLPPSFIKQSNATQQNKCEGKTFQGHDTPLFNDSLVETEQPVCPSTSSSNGERYGFVPALNWDGIEPLVSLPIPDSNLLEFVPNQDGCRVTIMTK
jgi:hypothetical protein